MPRSRFVITYLLKYRLNVDVRASAHVTGQLIVKGNIFLNDSGWYTKFFLFSSFGYRGTCVPVSQEQCGTSLRRDEGKEPASAWFMLMVQNLASHLFPDFLV